MPTNPDLKTQAEINKEFKEKLDKWDLNSKGISDKEKQKMKLCGDCASICAARKSKDMKSICKCAVDGNFVELNRFCLNGHFKVREAASNIS